MVCRSVRRSDAVCHTSEPYKNGFTDRDAVWVEVSGGPKEPCIRWGSRSTMGRGNFEGKGAPHCKVYGHAAVICAKTSEPLPPSLVPPSSRCRLGCRQPKRHLDRFRRFCTDDRRNHVLDGGPAVLRNVAMATNFGKQFAITGFMGYNFGCMIRSDTLFDSRGWVLGVKLSDELRHSRF